MQQDRMSPSACSPLPVAAPMGRWPPGCLVLTGSPPLEVSPGVCLAQPGPWANSTEFGMGVGGQRLLCACAVHRTPIRLTISPDPKALANREPLRMTPASILLGRTAPFESQRDITWRGCGVRPNGLREAHEADHPPARGPPTATPLAQALPSGLFLRLVKGRDEWIVLAGPFLCALLFPLR